MESVNRKVLVVAAALALITSFLIYSYLRNASTKPETVKTFAVYIAAETMPAKHKLVEGDIHQIQVAKEFISKTAVMNKEQILGKRLKDRVIAGEQILKERLTEDNNLTLSYNIPEGLRAISININEQVGVANLMRPGDCVDVIASFDKDETEVGNSKIISPRISKIILQNIQVLALAQGQIISDEILKESPKTATLAVTAQEAEKLVYASEYGSIRLALRPKGEFKNTPAAGAIRSDLTGDKGVIVTPK